MSVFFEQLALLTRLLGAPLSAHALAAQTLRSLEGRLDIQSLSEVLRSQGYDNQLSNRTLADIPAAALPVLLVYRDGGAAVLSAVSRGSGDRFDYEIINADGSSKLCSAEEIQAQYSGYCWFLKVRPQQDRRSELPEYTLRKGWFWKVIWRFRSYYYQVIITSVLINVLALIGSLYVMNVYDRVIPNRAYETLWVLSIGVLGAIVLEFLARTIRARLTDVAGKKADLIISSALFRRVMSIDLAEKPASSGSYANNLRDFESVRDFMTSASLLALVDLPFILMFILVMWMVAGPLALIPLATIPLVIGAGLLAQVPLAKYTNQSMRESSQRQGLAVEALEGLETLKTNNATNWAQHRWERFTAITANASIKLRDWSNGVLHFSQMVQQSNTVALVLWGTYLIHDENPASRITMGALIACVILSGRALAPLSQFASLMVRMQQARVALAGLNSIVERKTERDADRSYISLSHPSGEITLSGASYRYRAGQQHGPLVLQGLNITIRPGEKVGILGRIGSGKSTLLRMAAGLYHPTDGNVLLDGIDMRQVDPADLRTHVSLLGQTPRIFLGTLRENLDMGRMDRLSSDDELIASLRRFGLDQLVRAHPLGLNMPIGEDGYGLSGGQKQIVSLARLTLRDPRVVLLDEPTNGLDNLTEVAVLKALAEWTKERTLIMVTHRMQVLPLVDRVIVIDQGRVVIDGPRDAVLQRLANNSPGVTSNAPKRTASKTVVTAKARPTIRTMTPSANATEMKGEPARSRPSDQSRAQPAESGSMAPLDGNVHGA